MADRYRCIGFPAPDALTLVQLLRRTVLDGVRTPRTDGCSLVRWHDDTSGARINVVLTPEGVVRSAKPSFLPTVCRPVKARIHGLHPDSSNADADVVKITVRDAELPWSVEFEEGAAAVAALSFGEESALEVVGFADQLECFEDEGAFAASGVALGAREMLPAGIHALGRDRAGQRMSSLVSGVVMEVEQLHNTLSGESFLHLVIDTTPVPLDVVVSPHEVHGPSPRRGHVVTGSLWLVARQVLPASMGPHRAEPAAVGAAVGAAVVPVRLAGTAVEAGSAGSGAAEITGWERADVDLTAVDRVAADLAVEHPVAATRLDGRVPANAVAGVGRPAADAIEQRVRPVAPGRRDRPRLFSRWC